MQWADGGSLDDLIEQRLGRKRGSANDTSADDALHARDNPALTKSARIRAFRAYQKAQGEGQVHFDHQSGPKWTAVHLLSAEEIFELFQDIVEGLAFLVSL